MKSVPQILVFHRNRLFRECLAQVLSQSSDHKIRPAEHEPANLSQLLSDSHVDVILVDLNLPNNCTLQLIEEAVKHETKVVILVPDDHEQLVECIAAGAHACVLERSTLDELKPAIANVLRGQTYCSTDIVQSLYSQLKKLAREVTWKKHVTTARLTARETEVLELMSERLSNKQIARRLSVSLYTVKNHVHSILEKLQVETRLDAVEDAKERRLLDAQ
jgi:DNA-binding NarL/FixJ family response regulator